MIATDRTYIFEKMPVGKAIAKLAIPTVLSQLVTLIYNLADTFYVGQTGDPNQVAALTLSFPVFMMLTFTANLLGTGANSLISRSLGVGDTEKAKNTAAFSFYSALAIGCVLIVLLISFMKPFLTLLGASENTLGYTCDYLTWVFCIGGLPTIASLVMAHMFRGEGNTKYASIGIALGGILNIILDPIFIFVLDMDVAGAAIATAISNCVSFGFFLVILWRKRRQSVLSLSPKRFTFKQRIPSQVFLVGIPAALIILLGSTGNAMLTHLAAAFPEGDTAVAAFGVNQKLGSVVIYMTLGITQGVMPLIGYNYAAGNSQRVSSICKTSLLIVSVYNIICMIIMELFADTLVKIFINDPATIELGAAFNRRWILCALGMGITFVCNAAFQAMGYWKQSLLLSSMRQGIVFMPALFILSSVMGLYGLVWAQPVADVVAMAVGLLLYRSTMKKQKNEIILPQ